IVTTLTLGYLALLGVASGVTVPGSWHIFIDTVQSGLRGTLWTGVIGLMVFSSTFLFSVIFEKWWVGVIAGAIALIGMFYFLGAKIFEWLLTNVFKNSGKNVNGLNLDLYAQIDPIPILTMLVVTAAFYFSAQYMFSRKEMK